ncbi:hypothetical protein ACTVCO_01945 [Sanguibacter sp. A247]|uniref:hypothetical protein n=1 Tax=unclassified Sanguibacter TaxID=2645534 RepID=UPI003FD89F91
MENVLYTNTPSASRRLRLAPVTLAAVAALTLSACAADAEVSDGTSSTPHVGATLTAAQAANLQAAEGDYAYTLPDGTLVRVNARQALPAAVSTDIARRTTETIVVPSADAPSAARDAATALATEVGRDTGKYVAVVFEDFGDACGTLDTPAVVWTSNVNLGDGCTSVETRAEARARVGAYVDKAMGGHDTWLVLGGE